MDSRDRDMAWAPYPLRPYSPLIINVALTGAVPTKAVNPRLPVAPAEIVRDVLACAEAGATAFHIHVRDERGQQTHRSDLYQQVFEGIRDVRQDLVLCATTTSRGGGSYRERLIGIELPKDLRPDMASLSLGSFNFPTAVSNNPPDQIRALLDRMNELGVRPEFEVFEFGMINTLHSLIHEGRVPYRPVVNVLLGSLGSAPAFISELARIVDHLPPGSEWAAAGIGRFQRPITVAASVLGGNVRTGLEDNPTVAIDADEGWSNQAAVMFTAEASRIAGRSLEDPAGTRLRLLT